MPNLDSTTDDLLTTPPPPSAETAAAAEAETAEAKRARRAAQSRLNAKKSTGPKSPEGKERSRRNAVKHGQTAVLVYSAEDAVELNYLSRQLHTDYRPQGQLEDITINRLVSKEHRLRSLSVQISTTERYLASETKGVPKRAAIHAKLALHRDDDPARFHQLDLLYRYQREAERDWLRTTQTLNRLQRSRQTEARESLADQRRIARDLDGWHFRNTSREQLKDLGIENLSPKGMQMWERDKKLWEEKQKKREEEREAFERELAERAIERKKDDEQRRQEKEKEQQQQEEDAAPDQPEPAPENHQNEVTEPEPNQELTPETPPQN